MAGRATHLRPHTLATAKSLLKIAGKSVIYRTIENLMSLTEALLEELVFIIREPDEDIETELHRIATTFSAACKIYYQQHPLGTAHALLCAAESLQGEVLVAFTDRLFEAENTFNRIEEAVVWVKKVEHPEQYDIVKLHDSQLVNKFYHMPDEYVSEFALIGVYYFKDATNFLRALRKVYQDNQQIEGEFQLISVLQLMNEQGTKFLAEQTTHWFDLSNKAGIIRTTQHYLSSLTTQQLIHENVQITHSIIIPPVYIGSDVTVENSVIGPFVCLDEGTTITNSVLQDTLIGEHTHINRGNLVNSLIGNHVKMQGTPASLNVGDYNQIDL